MRLIYTEDAIEDLLRLRRFLAEHDPAAAARVARELIQRIEHIQRFPKMGLPVSLAPDPTSVRDSIFGKYIVRYIVHGRDIAILRVWHHREDRSDSG